ncbi:MAG: biotin/lipoyl-binding protein [Clostridia bacterium]|nr:biotin/lipoyl-binding protein [Clostridia bacterium]
MKYLVTLNGKTYAVEVEQTNAVLTAVTEAPASAAPAAQTPAAAPIPAAQQPLLPAEGQAVRAPMPGNILSVSISQGQRVKSGTVLMILEAMKMENEIVAPCDGTVKQLLVQKGSVVDTDAVLAVIG